ncbi:MAG: PAS domain-containing protein [Desulfobacteraceae bacterium]|nr:PAS domain-containing protein [Desulfobacteraceae bacterium]
MRLRLIILVLALLAFLSASTGGWLYYYSLKQSAFHDAENYAHTRSELLRRQLNLFLSEHIRPVRALAGLKELRMVLEKSDRQSMIQVNAILDNFALSLDLDTCYLMNRHGITVASSNRNRADSFVGQDFSFRPYFKKAILGRSSTYLALGATSNRRGVYYSHPVYEKEGINILGVAVIKSSVELAESKLFTESEEVLLVTDPNGMVFVSNREDLRFNLLWRLDPAKIEEIKASKQFGNGPWPWAGFRHLADGHVRDREGTGYLFSALALDSHPGWKIIHLRDLTEIGKHLAGPFMEVVGPGVLIVSILIGISVVILYSMALQEILRRKTAEKELRWSEARYRDIYHKTPVMLHSIDTTGNIIRVSDYWLEKMGYDRDEVIGRPLTSFYSEASRRYAEGVILPEFFRTGVCTDVPYTYVKKNRETIDTLLSCYGVRDDHDRVVRSLAVSVDVTEKNQVQKELEKATQKLSTYSMDLERRVEKRTVELKKAEEKLRRLSGRIMAAHEIERRALARELHDHLGQVLTALRMDAVWIVNFLAKRDEDAAERAGRICALIDNTIGDVRDMAFRLRPGVLDDLGLEEALESLTGDFEKRSEITCLFQSTAIPPMDDTLATALYRIAQEALTNAMRHSRATVVGVVLTMDTGELVLTIKDNGTGFAFDDIGEASGFGLAGMQERATLAGGTLDISSEQGLGTRVCCRVRVGEV